MIFINRVVNRRLVMWVTLLFPLTYSVLIFRATDTNWCDSSTWGLGPMSELSSTNHQSTWTCTGTPAPGSSWNHPRWPSGETYADSWHNWNFHWYFTFNRPTKQEGHVLQQKTCTYFLNILQGYVIVVSMKCKIILNFFIFLPHSSIGQSFLIHQHVTSSLKKRSWVCLGHLRIKRGARDKVR